MFTGRRIILGVTGSIAAYKAAEIAGNLRKQGAEVRTLLTASALKFITATTLETVSGGRVYTEMFSPGDGPVHIELAGWGDLLLIAPATANILGKVAGGIADDILTTTIMAFEGPVLFCPAMNSKMYLNPIVQRNIKTLREMGYHIVSPENGHLACGAQGPGRLAGVDAILERAAGLLKPQDLKGTRVLVTAGPTREPLDPVRYLSNRSSGKMGYAVARAARDRGAQVVLISGPTSLLPPSGVTFIPVTTALEMYHEVLARFPECDVAVKAAAVADYRPRETAGQKIKKEQERLTLALEKNPDILARMGQIKEKQVLVGFIAETESLTERARDKVRRKNLDLGVANDVTLPGAGFDEDTNIVLLVFPDGRVEKIPRMSKYALAHRIWDEVVALRQGGADE
ncbi:MAG: bifunctional phosphopantothenoylcysteine decarboxylase/phosphopantothenate--cysteine ligase CoaBC [Peptococcaceae bacterium]|nr:bifunctional phosphopantothenoylcysteine decarboxylase/phosphopantothenate--cysteine ligase CoaBC [Peptococcaceae bacterium]